MNKVILIGNLGKDPEVKQTEKIKFARFTLATNERIKDGKKTTWHNIVAFGKLAEIIEQYLKSGDKICIEGRIDVSKKDDKYYTGIIAEKMEMLGGGEPEKKAEQTEGKEEENDLPF